MHGICTCNLQLVLCRVGSLEKNLCTERARHNLLPRVVHVMYFLQGSFAWPSRRGQGRRRNQVKIKHPQCTMKLEKGEASHELLRKERRLDRGEESRTTCTPPQRRFYREEEPYYVP